MRRRVDYIRTCNFTRMGRKKKEKYKKDWENEKEHSMKRMNMNESDWKRRKSFKETEVQRVNIGRKMTELISYVPYRIGKWVKEKRKGRVEELNNFGQNISDEKWEIHIFYLWRNYRTDKEIKQNCCNRSRTKSN